MTTKNAEKLNGKSTPEMKVEKSSTLKTASTGKSEVKEPTIEELQKQVQALTSKLQSVPQNLEARIEYFNGKKELIRKLGKLEKSATDLKEHLDNIAEISAANDFETDEFILTIEAGGKYNRSQVFALQNPVMIGEVITYVLGKMEAKIGDLKKQIEA